MYVREAELVSRNVCKIEMSSSGAKLFLKRVGNDSGGIS